MRTKGSVRFEPYYKVQRWEPRTLSWRDIQRAHASEDAARAAFPVGERCRIMEITEKGRRPLPDPA